MRSAVDDDDVVGTSDSRAQVPLGTSMSLIINSFTFIKEEIFAFTEEISTYIIDT
jgi:hypothetical protein